MQMYTGVLNGTSDINYTKHNIRLQYEITGT
jgi:hypothetical protein